MEKILIYTYCFIAMYFFAQFATGNMDIYITDKDGKEIEVNNFMYFIICLIYSLGWIVLLFMDRGDE